MVQHFQEAGRLELRANHPPLSDLEFSRALDHLVIACVDVVLIHKQQLLLGQRNQYPRRDWWVIGGRMQVGESPLEAMIRKIDQETNLGLIACDRLQFRNLYSTCFTQRRQEPQNHGLHSLNLIYSLQLTSHEYGHVHLTPLEYETWKWVEVNDLPQLFPNPNILDRALLEVLNASKILRDEE